MRTKNQNIGPRTPLEQAQMTLKNARNNLLLMMIFTVVNIVLLIVQADIMFLFSATVPYFIVAVGIAWESTTAIVIASCIAAIGLLLYLLCWIESKKSYEWLIVALVFFSLDTVALIGITILEGNISGITDLVFHVWVIISLCTGIAGGKKAKALAKEQNENENEIETEAETETEEDNLPAFSAPLRLAEDTKHRVLLEYNWEGHRILYRRVKKVNELIIDNHVYAEYTTNPEFPHELSARYNSHTVCAGLTFSNRSYISIDGTNVADKLRLF